MPKKLIRKSNEKLPAKRTKRSTAVPLHHHVTASLRHLSPHEHTGKRIHSRHSSFGVLILLLAVTGVILFLALGTLRAYGYSVTGGAVTIGLTVNAAPPTVGATITSPSNGTAVLDQLLSISGTCPESLLVAIYDNGSSVGSTTCTAAGEYQLQITLQPGNNILQAQDYDGLNQPGPATAQINVVYTVQVITTRPTKSEPNGVVTVVPVNAKDIAAPTQPAPQPTVNPCYTPATNHDINQSGLIVRIACITRNVNAGDQVSLPIDIQGGESPYAVSIDWQDKTVGLKTVLSAGVSTFSHTYQTSGPKTITIRVSDSLGSTSYVQTVISVNGPIADGSTSGLANLAQTTTSTFKKLWIESPVPLYYSGVALTLGFWGGDIFTRAFGKLHKVSIARKK